MPKEERMSFESRRKKRRYKRIEAKAKQRRTTATARRWFVTLAKKPGKCSSCGSAFGRGAEIVYRRQPREIRCVRCASRAPDSKGYRPSLRWERKQRVAQ
jgi:hypothetical protein